MPYTDKRTAVAGASVAQTKINHWHKDERIKRCIVCSEDKPLRNFYAYSYVNRLGNPGTRYESRCKPCSLARRKARYDLIADRERQNCKRWYAQNRERIKIYNASRQANPEHRSLKAKAQRLRKARMRSGGENSQAVKEIYAEAMRVEALIQSCPVFDLPELGKKIHVDHIVPLSKGGLHVASNLQLLPVGLNMRKGVKCPK